MAKAVLKRKAKDAFPDNSVLNDEHKAKKWSAISIKSDAREIFSMLFFSFLEEESLNQATLRPMKAVLFHTAKACSVSKRTVSHVLGEGRRTSSLPSSGDANESEETNPGIVNPSLPEG